MKKNLLLAVAVIFVLVAALEAGFLYWFPRVFPTHLVLVLADEGLQPLLQSSKCGIKPHDYIALLGDSYAAGMGDWATVAMAKPMARYSSAHLLHEATGRDVVSFGSAGAGSVRGMVTEPVSQLAYLRQYVDKDLADPSLALVYFYAGNDLYDNAAYFHYSFPRLYPVEQQFQPDLYQRYLQSFAIEHDDTWWLAQRNDPWRHWRFPSLVDKLTRVALGRPARVDPPNPAHDPGLEPPWIFGGAMTRIPGEVNQAIIAGKLEQLPDALQGPAMALDEQEWQQAWFAFEQSLAYIRQAMPATQFVVVYIPSVLETYAIRSESVVVQTYERRATTFSREQAHKTALRVRETLADISRRAGVPVIDTSEALQRAAAGQALHGPQDWNHLNRAGYEVLASAIASGLASAVPPEVQQ